MADARLCTSSDINLIVPPFFHLVYIGINTTQDIIASQGDKGLGGFRSILRRAFERPATRGEGQGLTVSDMVCLTLIGFESPSLNRRGIPSS